MTILLAVFSILFISLAWFRPVTALQITLFALPAYLIRFNIGIPTTLLEIMILIDFGVWFLKNLHFIKGGLANRFKKVSGVIEYPFRNEMISVVAAGFIGLLVAGTSQEALGVWKAYFFEPLLLLIILYQLIGKSGLPFAEKIKKILHPFMFAALGVSVLAIYQKLTGDLISNPLWQAAATRRVVSVFGYPNAVGLYLETITIYAFGLCLLGKETSRKHLTLYIAVIITSLLSILFAKSVGAALGLAAGFSLIALLYSAKSRKAFASIVLTALILIFGAGIGRNKAVEYLTLSDFSGQVRVIGWEETWKMLKDGRILTGAGLSNFQKTVAPYHVPGFYYNRDRDPDFHRKLLVFDEKYRAKYWQPLEIYMYPHNIFLNFWSELSLFGLIVFIWLLVKFFWVAASLFKKSNDNDKLLLITAMAAMTTIIIHGMVDVPFFKNDLAIIFWLPIAIVGLHRLHQQTR